MTGPVVVVAGRRREYTWPPNRPAGSGGNVAGTAGEQAPLVGGDEEPAAAREEPVTAPGEAAGAAGEQSPLAGGDEEPAGGAGDPARGDPAMAPDKGADCPPDSVGRSTGRGDKTGTSAARS